MAEPAQLLPPPVNNRNNSGSLITAWIAVIISILAVAFTVYVWTQADIAINRSTKAAQQVRSLDTELDTLEARVDALSGRQKDHSTKILSQQSALQSQQSTIQNLQTTDSLAAPSMDSSASSTDNTTDNDNPPSTDSTAANQTTTQDGGSLSELHKKQKSIEKKMSSSSDTLQGMQQQFGQQQSILKQQSDTIARQQHQLNQQSTSLQQQQLSLQNTRNQLNKLLNSNSNSSRQWLLNEAEYLVRLAHLQLSNNNNISAALNLLKSADQDIASINDPKMQPIRVALQHDIQILEDTKPTPVGDIIKQLNSVSENVANLPATIKTKFTNTKEGKPTTEKNHKTTEESSATTGYQAAIAGIKNLVVIKKINTAPKSLSSIEEINYIKENIRLKISQAEWAVLHSNQKLYEQNLSLAQNLINKNLNDAKIKNMVTKINNKLEQLKKRSVAITAPKLYTSIATIRAMINKQQHNSNNIISKPDINTPKHNPKPPPVRQPLTKPSNATEPKNTPAPWRTHKSHAPPSPTPEQLNQQKIKGTEL